VEDLVARYLTVPYLQELTFVEALVELQSFELAVDLVLKD
jgi:hypothetical protein